MEKGLLKVTEIVDSTGSGSPGGRSDADEVKAIMWIMGKDVVR